MKSGFPFIDESEARRYEERCREEEERRRMEEEFLRAKRKAMAKEEKRIQIEDRNAEWDDFKSIRTVGFLRSPLRIGPHLIPWYTSGFQ